MPQTPATIAVTDVSVAEGVLPQGSCHPDHGPDGVNEVALRRMRSIIGQVRGIEKMIDDERYCIDIVNQISAVRGALARVSELVLRRHIETCVVSDLRGGTEADQERVIDELMDVIARKVK